MLSRFHLIPERHGRTDGQIELLCQYRASVSWRAIKRWFTVVASGNSVTKTTTTTNSDEEKHWQQRLQKRPATCIRWKSVVAAVNSRRWWAWLSTERWRHDDVTSTSARYVWYIRCDGAIAGLSNMSLGPRSLLRPTIRLKRGSDQSSHCITIISFICNAMIVRTSLYENRVAGSTSDDGLIVNITGGGICWAVAPPTLSPLEVYA